MIAMEIWISGNVYTQGGRKEAFVTDEGKFVYVGDNEGALHYEGCVHDLKGAFVCAGFNDSHMHLLHFGESLISVNLAACTDSLSGMLEGLRRFAKVNPVEKGKWLIGLGFNQDYFQDEKRFPNRYDLDLVSMEFPVMALRACGHMCVVNSKALEVMGLTADSLQVEGGHFDVDENGEPTGIFWETAIELVNAALPVYTLEDVKRMLEAACCYVNQQGITSVQSDDLMTLPGVDYEVVIQAYQELAEEGKLTVRVYEQSQMPDCQTMQEFLDRGYKTGCGDTMFRIGPLKVIGDGSLGARTAYMQEPYSDAKLEHGIEVCPYEKMVSLVRLAHTHGMQVAVHAIGDGAMENVLRTYETVLRELPKTNHRHGVVHCQIMQNEQYERFAKLGLHAYIQSVFLDYDTKIVEERTGKERAESSYGFLHFLNQGATVSNGSDAPVEIPDVFRGIQCAVTRQSLSGDKMPYRADQAFSVKQALDSYTAGGAFASFEEAMKGDIREGMLADFVVLDQDPFAVEPTQLAQIKAKKTVLGGKCVYDSTSI